MREIVLQNVKFGPMYSSNVLNMSSLKVFKLDPNIAAVKYLVMYKIVEIAIKKTPIPRLDNLTLSLKFSV